MTTPAAEQLYLAQHLVSLEGKGYAVYNPQNMLLFELPAIYGFNNGGSNHWYEAVAIAEDGTVLGGHICSHEGYMAHDLGMIEGTRPDRHETFREHYPNGYRMEFVPSEAMESHPGLNAAIAANKAKQVKDQQST
jgi:hypothetical protein